MCIVLILAVVVFVALWYVLTLILLSLGFAGSGGVALFLAAAVTIGGLVALWRVTDRNERL